MRYLDRHRVELLLDYAGVGEGDRTEALTEDVRVYVQIAYDQATDVARAAFVSVTEGIAGEWPWTAVVPINLELETADEFLASVEYGPPAILLLLGRDVSEADSLDPDSILTDEIGESALADAIRRWETDAITEAIGPDGWIMLESQPAIQPDPDAPDEPGNEEPDATEEPDTDDTDGPEDDSDPPADAGPAIEFPQPPTPPFWRRWEFVAGVAGAATIAAVVVVARSRRNRVLPPGA